MSENPEDLSIQSSRVIGPPPKINTPKQPNVIVQFFRAVFGYRKTSVSLLIAVTFAVIVVLNSLFVNVEYAVKLPSKAQEMSLLESSWLDLQKISECRHPYVSHANDYVHDYIYGRIEEFTAGKSYIEIDNDFDGDDKFIFSSSEKSIVYFESDNLLVRINGTDPNLPALLISAHYDSVPTAYGTTDDGMGIASMLGVLKHFAQSRQPKRTIVFNFNNHEEFGLMGAVSFFNHPFSEGVEYFINLEGTGAGGLAYLFRGTDYGVLKPFTNVRYPMGTSIFQQGFSSGLVHSETDYKIYREHGLRGIDIAFIKPRDFYHTNLDSIRYTSKKSLWHMLSNALDYVKILSEEEYVEGSLESGVFGNVLSYFFVFEAAKLLVLNLFVILAMPVINTILLMVVVKRGTWNISVFHFLRYPFTLAISILINITLAQFFLRINPFLPSSDYNLPLLVLLSSVLIVNYLLLNLFSTINEVHDEKLLIILVNSFVSWILLVGSTYGLWTNPGAHSGEFVVGFVYSILSIGSFFGLLGLTFRSPIQLSDDESTPLLVQVDSDEDYASVDHAPQEQPASTIKQKIKYFSFDWSLQFLIIVPVASFFLYNYGSLMLEGINQTSQESLASTKFIWSTLTYWSLALSLPILPFVLKFNRFLIIAIFAIIGLGTFYTLNVDPFNETHPLKLRVIQTIDLNSSPSEALVNVYGREGFIGDILQDIPSVKESNILVICTAERDGTETCVYPGAAPNLIDNFEGVFADYLDIKVLKNSSDTKVPAYTPLVGEVVINTPKNRICVVSFNKTTSAESPVKTVIVYQDEPKPNVTFGGSENIMGISSKIPDGASKDSEGNDIYKSLKGIDEIQLHKLDWDKPFHIGFQWIPNLIDFDGDSEKDNSLGVTVKCYWGELDESVQNGVSTPKVPAFDELLQYSPKSISYSNKDKGMVVISKYIVV